METRVMLTMESRIHGDMYVRFGGWLVETYHRKVAKRYWPSLLKEIADVCGIKKTLSTHLARHTFACIAIANKVSMESIAKMLGHSDLRTTKIYAKLMDKTVSEEMNVLKRKFSAV